MSHQHTANSPFQLSLFYSYHTIFLPGGTAQVQSWVDWKGDILDPNRYREVSK